MATATESTIEQRLAALETAIAEIRRQLAASAPSNGPERVSGRMKDEPAFAEVIAPGRAFRGTHRPPDEAEMTPPVPASQGAASTQDAPPDPPVPPSGQGEPSAAEPTTRAPIKRAKMDDQGRLIPLAPAEGQAEAKAIRAMLDELRSIPNDPDEDDAEFFRAIDSHRPHRPLFEGLY